MESSHPSANAARSAAQRLASEFGHRLPAEVERELHQPATDQRPPDQYIDLIAIASLVVSTATLAWNIYQDIRRRGAQPQPETIVRRIRIEAPRPQALTAAQHDQIITVIVEETAHQAQPD